MKRTTLTIFIISAFIVNMLAGPGDTTVIQTFSFDLGRSNNKVDTFQFPDNSKTYSKVLMYYTIKCDPSGDYVHSTSNDYPCGEWDYDVYTDILKPTGSLDTAGNPIFDVWRLWAYITPYGIGLDRNIDILNKEGWTYVYDVTDFLPLLRDEVVLRDGNAQELVDIRFAFIEGVPVRQVKDIKKVWQSNGVVYEGHWPGYPLSEFDNIVKDTTFAISSDEKYVKLRTTVTGHFFGKGRNCGEFCPNFHSVTANGQLVRKWQIIQECSENPIYPQGGTWVFDRAGWCPGTEGKTNEFDLTPYVNNDSVTFDYNVESDSYGVYRITGYLVTYGEILQDDDVEAEMIISPTDNPNQRRFNPSAFSPVVVIKNIGKNPLSAVSIKYGFIGDTVLTQQWSGNLKFLQKDTVILKTIPNWDNVNGDKAEFYFELESPNQQSDPTPYNNRITSVCQKPVVYEHNKFRFDFTTNKRPRETSWQLTDVEGNILYAADTDTLKSSKLYKNEIFLEDGTYCLSIYDSGQDGLGWWANEAAGKGAAILKGYNSDGRSIKTLYSFNIDFGAFSKLYFAVNKFNLDIDHQNSEIRNKIINVFPNPAEDEININLLNIDKDDLQADVFDVYGKRLSSKKLNKLSINTMDTSSLTEGVYMVLIKSGKERLAIGKFIVNRNEK